MIIEMHDVWDSVGEKHENYVKDVIRKFLAKRSRFFGPVLPQISAAIDFIAEYQGEISCRNIVDYRGVIKNYNYNFPVGSDARVLSNAFMRQVFNYDSFIRKKGGWDAYKLCSGVGYKICPYCQIHPLDIEPVSRAYRFQIDHFYSKDEYPFLALSLGNMVPSCGQCNGPSFKHETDFWAMPHLNPLLDKSLISFRLDAVGEDWSVIHETFRLPKARYRICVEVPSPSVLAMNSLMTFHLESRYQNFLHDAYRIARKGGDMKIFNESRCKSLFLKTGISVVDWHVELGFSPGDNDYKNIPQGKMRLDVFNRWCATVS